MMSGLIHEQELQTLTGKLGYEFKNGDLLAEALRHASYVNELTSSSRRDNERLEFLGDAVLDLAISHILMDLFEDAKEGDLSKYRASVVNEKGLFQVAKELQLGNFLMLGKGEELSGGREKPSLLANAFEALIGALYLDSGFLRTKEIINALFLPYLSKIDREDVVEDFKSLLQEYTQESLKTRPDYVLIDERGPAHDKVFTVALRLNGEIMSEGVGRSKKEAEQRAAKEAFHCLSENPKNH